MRLVASFSAIVHHFWRCPLFKVQWSLRDASGLITLLLYWSICTDKMLQFYKRHVGSVPAWILHLQNGWHKWALCLWEKVPSSFCCFWWNSKKNIYLKSLTCLIQSVWVTCVFWSSASIRNPQKCTGCLRDTSQTGYRTCIYFQSLQLMAAQQPTHFHLSGMSVLPSFIFSYPGKIWGKCLR